MAFFTYLKRLLPSLLQKNKVCLFKIIMPLFPAKYKKILKNFSCLILLFTLAGSCQQKPDLPGFDQEAWRKDTRSCQNIRPGLLAAFNQISPKLVGLRHTTIIKILGKPEGNSLEKSGQRTYYYFVEAGPHCNNPQHFKEANKVFLRFDVLDRVNLITIKK